MHRLFVAVSVLGALAGSACGEKGLPGSEEMGIFDFTAFVAPPPRNPGECDFLEMPTENFQFTGTFSRNPENPDDETFYTLRENDRPAGFDGQVASSVEKARRRFEACGCADGTEVEETITVALLSRSQRDALPDPFTCPADPLNGGIPAGEGITLPESTPAGFDAVLACGTLVDRLLITTPDECQCAECSTPYRIQGVRK